MKQFVLSVIQCSLYKALAPQTAKLQPGSTHSAMPISGANIRIDIGADHVKLVKERGTKNQVLLQRTWVVGGPLSTKGSSGN
ncbi:hypothetical protein [Paenibacillus sp. Soil766]|uniref:hypothetical protein n=1 Tax=Paenibacillus sp. Soil766 TaxID=1736404 RepID=UPI001F3670A5|nr:hypothetical protein [Paenibacillus sp. Soil766]